MNRLFGRAKPKEPPPSLTDCIAGVRMKNLLLKKTNNVYLHFLFLTVLLCYFDINVYIAQIEIICIIKGINMKIAQCLFNRNYDKSRYNILLNISYQG